MQYARTERSYTRIVSAKVQPGSLSCDMNRIPAVFCGNQEHYIAAGHMAFCSYALGPLHSGSVKQTLAVFSDIAVRQTALWQITQPRVPV